MNLENTRKFLEQLDKLPEEKFDMSVFILHGGCGTVGCLAGWCSMLNGGPDEEDEIVNDEVFDFAKDFLGLHEEEAERLFTPSPEESSWRRNKPISEITKTEAAAELRRLMEQHERENVT